MYAIKVVVLAAVSTAGVVASMLQASATRPSNLAALRGMDVDYIAANKNCGEWSAFGDWNCAGGSGYCNQCTVKNIKIYEHKPGAPDVQRATRNDEGQYHCGFRQTYECEDGVCDRANPIGGLGDARLGSPCTVSNQIIFSDPFPDPGPIARPIN